MNEEIKGLIEQMKLEIEGMADRLFDAHIAKVAPTPKLAEALAKAQQEIKPPIKNRTVDFTFEGKRTKYSYADLADVIEALKPLGAHGLAVTHTMERDGAAFILRTSLVHSSGEERSTIYPIQSPANMKPQTFGALMTYARRYSLSALTGIASDEDTDADGDPAPAAAPAAKKEAAAPREKVSLTNKPAPANPAPASNVEKQKIVAYLKDRKISTGIFQKYLKDVHSATDVRAGDVEVIMALLKDEGTSEMTLMARCASAAKAADTVS